MHSPFRPAAPKSLSATLCLGALLAVSQPAAATEYGLGNYLLGYSLPMTGFTPPPGVYYSNTFYLYSGSASPTIKFPLGKHLDAGIGYSIVANISQISWVTDLKILGGSLGFAALLPLIAERTTASLEFVGRLGVQRECSRTGSTNALGDSAYAAFIGWDSGEHHWNATLTGFAPTGYDSSTSISFTGLNRPGVDIKGGYTYLSLQTGFEASAALGITINAVNSATNYQSGDELHFEGALMEHLPFGLAAGVGGYYYQQVTPDSGSGDRLGAFRGRVASIGPLLTYTFQQGAQQVTVSGRWFHEFDVANRVQGNSVFASLSFPL
ncbi:SphA family protein [Methylocapsa acidiphila]|uniref:SphA family protein n=1 Tax=Methylocapsa acidiphila TaxID=133552 RepID=UPI000405E69C|nr:transporter [Methylocapsa acidiphila]